MGCDKAEKIKCDVVVAGGGPDGSMVLKNRRFLSTVKTLREVWVGYSIGEEERRTKHDFT